MAFVAAPSHSLLHAGRRPPLTASGRPARPGVGRRQACRMLVVEANSPKDMDLILTSAKDALVVVDYSTTWCGPCKIIAPQFEEMSNKHEDVVFVKVMGDSSAEASELMKREGIRAVPAFHFWKNNERIHSFVGAKLDEIKSTIEENT